MRRIRGNIPNVLSAFRIALALVFITILHDIFAYSCAKNLFLLLTFLAIILSDVLDGYLARKYHRASNFGAAPGSWSLYALRKLAERGLVVACNLAPLSPKCSGALSGGGGFVFVQGDFTAPGVRAALLARGPYRLILSDAAPATTGSASVDAQRSFELAAALDCALAALAPGGSLAVKVFQGGDAAPLHRALKAAFTQTRSFKPRASRPSSVETYLLGLGKR